MYTTNGSFSLGTLAGIPFRVHWSVVLIAVFFGTGLAGQYGAIGAVAAIVMFLGSILAHELAHALTARRYGVQTTAIQLWALGGVAQLDREAPTARAEGWIAVAGPLASLTIGLTSAAAVVTAVALDHRSVGIDIISWLGLVNVVLAVFNMLPGSPLDGGRVLKAWRWGRHGDKFRAAKEAGNAGKAVGFSMAGVGAVMVFNGLPGIMLIVTGVFIAISANAEIAASDLAHRLQGVRVRDLTWFGVAHASTDTDADTMLWQRSRLGGAGVVAVERANGDLAGVVSEEQLLSLPVERRPFVPLAALMTPFDRVAQADPDEELSAVLSRLNPAAPFVTVWREGKLLGVVPRALLLAKLKAASTKP
ncbi:MAG: site-2 protease family protein [Ilumatobacteraceae bacterium]